eukprot:1532505-Amphidinium_carterae.2
MENLRSRNQRALTELWLWKHRRHRHSSLEWEPDSRSISEIKTASFGGSLQASAELFVGRLGSAAVHCSLLCALELALGPPPSVAACAAHVLMIDMLAPPCRSLSAQDDERGRLIILSMSSALLWRLRAQALLTVLLSLNKDDTQKILSSCTGKQ